MAASGQPTMTEQLTPTLTDYDFEDYDYRTFWEGREYERWAESRVLERLMRRVGPVPWLADYGGGFGRNTGHYRARAARSVLVDYSLGNLRRASEIWADEVIAGRLFLIRADLYRLPFVDGAFHAGLLIRVLHHLTDLDRAVAEMGRTITRHWLLDVPIKNHLLAVVRAGRRAGELRSPEPMSISSDHRPFWNFNLESVRETLGRAGFDSEVIASVNNFRRWERVLPPRATRALWPLMCGMELAAQRVGRGWWGPSQFLVATRSLALLQPTLLELSNHRQKPDGPWSVLATRVVCPTCHGPLKWTAKNATCARCRKRFQFEDQIWDFLNAEDVVPVHVPAVKPKTRSSRSRVVEPAPPPTNGTHQADAEPEVPVEVAEPAAVEDPIPEG